MERRYVPVAEVARPHGIRGELRLKLYHEGSDLLLQLRTLRLRAKDGAERDVDVERARPSDKVILIKLVGVDDRNGAEALRDHKVLVPRDAFPVLPEGEFYAADVEGARAVLSSGEEVGLVSGLQSYPTCDVLLVRREQGTLEVPLTDAYVVSVDVAGGVVELHTIEGLS